MMGATPRQLLGWARNAITGVDSGWGPSWSQAATFLTRAALEDAVAAYWTGPLMPLAADAFSTQLLCLPSYLEDGALARSVHATWSQLSTACHAHAYELPPTVDELVRWMDVVERLVAATEAPADRISGQEGQP